MQPAGTIWQRASRIVAWAPDDARDLLIAASGDGGDDDLALAGTSELLARAFAVTGAWDLAGQAFEAAAASLQATDAARAHALRGIAAQLPLEPFASDGEAIDAELDLIARAVDPQAPAPVVRRAVVELRRSLAPRRITGVLEAAFEISAMELAFVMAAAAPILRPESTPLLPASAWGPLIASSSLGVTADCARLLRLGIVREAPELVPHPALVSRLLGRTEVVNPSGVHLRRIPPIGKVGPGADDLARDLVTGTGIGVVVGPTGSGRRTAIANLVARRGLATYSASTVVGTPAALIDAAVEARLHGGLIIIDLDEWPGIELATVAGLAPIVAVSTFDPPIPRELRAFTMQALGVSSSR